VEINELFAWFPSRWNVATRADTHDDLFDLQLRTKLAFCFLQKITYNAGMLIGHWIQMGTFN